MGWSGATFTLLHDFSAFRDANPGAEYIDADDVDEQFTDLKGGLEALLLRDGSNSPSGNIDWNGQKITNLGAPTADAHAARRQDIDSRALKFVANTVAGLTTSNNSTDSDHDIDIGTGICVSTDQSTAIQLTSGLTKQLDASWAVGTNQGGLDTGSIAASTGYYIWIIRRSDTGVVDGVFSTSSTWAGVTKPINYDAGQLIGFVRTDSSSNIFDYVQSGDLFYYTETTIPFDVSDTSLTSATYETATIKAPANAWAHLAISFINISATGNNGYLYLAYADTVSPPASVPYRMGFETAADFDRLYHKAFFPVNASSQIKYAAQWVGGSGETVQIYCNGFLMTTRGNAP